MFKKIVASLSIFLILLAGAWLLNNEDDTMIYHKQDTNPNNPYNITPLSTDGNGNDNNVIDIFESKSPFNPREYVKFRRVFDQEDTDSTNE